MKKISPLMFTDEIQALRKCTDRTARTWAKKVREQFGLLERDILPDEIVAQAMGISMERLLMWRIAFHEDSRKGNTLCFVFALPFLKFLFGPVPEL